MVADSDRLVYRMGSSVSNSLLDSMPCRATSAPAASLRRELVQDGRVDVQADLLPELKGSPHDVLEAADAKREDTDLSLSMKHMGLVLTPEQVRDLVLRDPSHDDHEDNPRLIDYRKLVADAFPTASTERHVMKRILAKLQDKGNVVVRYNPTTVSK